MGKLLSCFSSLKQKDKFPIVQEKEKAKVRPQISSVPIVGQWTLLQKVLETLELKTGNKIFPLPELVWHLHPNVKITSALLVN